MKKFHLAVRAGVPAVLVAALVAAGATSAQAAPAGGPKPPVGQVLHDVRRDDQPLLREVPAAGGVRRRGNRAEKRGDQRSEQAPTSHPHPDRTSAPPA